MDDPPRLLDDPAASPLGRTLLSSARSDAPSPDARARAARRLGVVAVLAATSAGGEAGAVAAGWKAAALVLALSSVVGVAIWQIAPRIASEPAPAPHAAKRGQGGPSSEAVPPEIAPPPSATVPMLAPAAPPAPPTLAPTAPMPAGPAPSTRSAPTAPSTSPPHARPQATPHAPVSVPPPAPPPAVESTAPPAVAPAPDEAPAPAPDESPAPAAPVTSTASRLAAEVALVDRARSRLAASDPRGALAALALYHQQFAAGDLAAEADAVAIEAWIALGDTARARSLADAFLSQFPRSPLAQRVHSLIARLPVAP